MALAQPKVNSQGFTAEEAAELEQADKEIAEQAATEPTDETELPVGERPALEDGPGPEPKPQDGDRQGKPPHGYVRLASLQEERKERQSLQEKMARMEGAFQQLVERVRGGQPQPHHQTQDQRGADSNRHIPEFNVDPLANLAGRLDVALQTIAALQGQHQQHSQATQQQQQYNAVMNRYANDWSSFARTTPDAAEAYNWIKGDAEAEIEARYPGIEPELKARILQGEEENIIANAYQRGKNPAQVIYDLAKRRGYKAKQPAQEENKLERLQKGQQASKSLSGTKGAANAGGSPETMTLATLSELMSSNDPADQAKADEMWETMSRRGLLG